MSNNYLLIIYFSLCISLNLTPRSPYRLPDQDDPMIKVRFNDSLTEYLFRESHLEEGIFYLFDYDYFMSRLLPAGSIQYRYEAEKSVTGTLLSTLIQEAVNEILLLSPYSTPELPHFHILKMRDINRATHAGLYVLKFKHFPFVVKIFIEVPQNFFLPGDKGFEPLCFYYMGGGVNRHLTGFTRVKNLEEVQSIIQHSSYWNKRVGFPRKWFWLPRNPRWIHLEGSNLGKQNTHKTKIPAIYAIVCDEIVWERQFSIKNFQDRQEALNLSNFLGQKIDMHINNFGIEKFTGKLVVMDFEHFPSMVGLKNDITYNSYGHWYTYLAGKMLQNTFWRNKYQRRCIQRTPYQPFRFNVEAPLDAIIKS